MKPTHQQQGAAQLDLWQDDVRPGQITWSLTRAKRLEECARKYFFHHVLSRGGADPKAGREQRQIFTLGRLRTRFMWVGEVVHAMLALALSSARRGERMPVDALVERGTRTMRAQYAESVQGLYHERPLTAFGLVEHEFREPVAREEWQEMRERMERAIRHAWALPVFEELMELPAWRWLALESASTFEHAGATVIVKPDAAWRDATGTIHILDWKTGQPRPADERRQLGIYGLYGRRAWSSPEGKVMGRVAYLESPGSEVVDELGADTWANAERDLAASVTQLRARGAAEIAPSADNFPKTTNQSTCQRCVFRRLCRSAP